MTEYSKVVLIGDVYVSTALLTERFVCDVALCKGQCCVIGDSGAPLEPQEVKLLEQAYSDFAPYMTAAGRESVAKLGVAVVDTDGEWVTPLVDGAECVYAWFDGGGVCRCAIEAACMAGKTTFRKPVSCWLYPIRVQKLATGKALNYHRWQLCAAARERGQKLGVPVYQFLKEPLEGAFGDAFYKELEESANVMT